MAQFTVYENPSRASRKTFPFLLDIQGRSAERSAHYCRDSAVPRGGDQR